jgi:GntR family transcriptional regulator
MRIVIQTGGPDPIYEQIRRQIRSQILNGELAPHTPLPSIRVLARQVGVSVITTKRAYDDLERDGYVYSAAGKGTFVAAAPASVRERDRQREIRAAVQSAVEAAIDHGISQDALVRMLKEEWDRRRDV